MRLYILNIISIFLFLSCALNAQNQEFVFAFDNIPLEEVLQQLENENDLLFSFKTEDIKSKIINGNFSETTLSGFLNKLFKNVGLNYEIIDGDYIVITNNDLTSEERNKVQKKTICGTVLNKADNAPLEFTNVVIEGSSMGTSTDSKGYFNLEIPSTTKGIISISYLGFETIKIPIAQFKSNDCSPITLSYPENLEAVLTIKEYINDAIHLSKNGAATQMNIDKIGSLPGQADTDVLAALQFLPGVGSATSRPADIYIRGCTPDQNLLLWEDIPIYHSAHYFGMISAFNPYTIQRVDVHRGGFGPEFGGRIAGVIELKSYDENANKSFTGVGSNSTNAYAYTHQIFGKKNPIAINFSARRSFSEVFRSPSFNNITKINQQGLLLGNMEVSELPAHITIEDDFFFTDAHLKISAKLNKSDKIVVAGLYSLNEFNDRIEDDKKMELQRDVMDLNNIGFNFKWIHDWNNSLSHSFRMGLTNYDYNYDYTLDNFGNNKTILKGEKHNDIQDQQIQFVIKKRFDDKQSYELGYNLVNYNIGYRTDIESFRSRDIRNDGDSQGIVNALYFKMTNPISNVLGYDVGIRANYFDLDQKIYFEPRIRIDSRISNSWSWHINYGVHHQFVSQLTIFEGNDSGINSPIWSLASLDKSVPVQKAQIFQLGFIYQKQNWIFDLQFFARSIDGLSSRAYEFDTLEDEQPVEGVSDIRGIDLLIKKKINNFRTWLSYSLSDTQFSFERVAKQEFPASYDQRHSLKWTNQYEHNNIAMSLGVKYSSGLPFTSIRSFSPIQQGPSSEGGFDIDYNEINSQRLGSLLEFNCGLTYKLVKKSYKGYLNLAITNFFDRENIYSRNYFIDAPFNDSAEINFTDKTNLRFTPELSVRVEF